MFKACGSVFYEGYKLFPTKEGDVQVPSVRSEDRCEIGFNPLDAIAKLKTIVAGKCNRTGDDRFVCSTYMLKNTWTEEVRQEALKPTSAPVVQVPVAKAEQQGWVRRVWEWISEQMTRNAGEDLYPSGF